MGGGAAGSDSRGTVTATVVVPPRQFAEATLTLDGSAYRHLFRARRLDAGERLRVVDGEGHARWGQVESVGRQSARLTLAEEAPTNEPPDDLLLLTALPRPERAAWLVEKATEVGVSAVRFLRCQRTARPLGMAQLDRLRRVALAAVEQCHRALVPEISGEYEFSELKAVASRVENAWVLDPGAESPLTPAPGSGVLAVGPEGGWSEEELSTLIESGFTPARLGDRALRVETAAVVAAGLLLLRAATGVVASNSGNAS